MASQWGCSGNGDLYTDDFLSYRVIVVERLSAIEKGPVCSHGEFLVLDRWYNAVWVIVRNITVPKI